MKFFCNFFDSIRGQLERVDRRIEAEKGPKISQKRAGNDFFHRLKRMSPEWLQKKLLNPEELEKKVAEIKERHLTIATLNGSFDLLHAGHLFIIHEAKKQADCLIVLLNSDSSIQKYKGENRPIVPLKYRLEMMAAIEFVDYITWFDERDPRAALQKIRPDVHVNGMEYGTNCIERETVEQIGGKLHLVDRIDGLSTSNLIEKIKQCV